jgi:WD40 repeat protein/serine/threonine protein kinase
LGAPREHDEADVFDFVDEYLRDAARGGPRGLAHYLARYRDNEEAIAREFLALEARRRGEAPERAQPAAKDGEKRIGPYRLVRELGRGGQGTVWLAEDTRIARRVALKFLPASFALLSADRRRRLQREAEVVSRLEHPAICAVYEAQIEAETPYIAMRFVEGETLASAIARAGERNEPGATVTAPASALPLPPRHAAELRRVLAFFERAARAVHAAHEAGVIHRDLKPGNLMVAPNGEPVVLDFGQARDETAHLGEQSLSGEVVGTPAYMSPEQIAAHAGGVDRRTDVWSLGAALYEALTLARPFEGRSVADLLLAIQSRPIADARALNPAIETDVAVVLETALEKDKTRRYASALELAEDLRRIREYEPIRARPAGPWLKLRRWVRRHPALATALAALFVSLSSGLAMSLYTLAREERALEFALGRHLAERSRDLLDEDPSASLALGIRAVELAPNFQTRAALFAALDACHLAALLDSEGARMFWDLDPAPDSRRVAAGLDDGVARVYDLATGRVLARMPGHPGAVRCVRFDRSGEMLVTASTDARLRVWRASDGELLRTLPTPADLLWLEIDRSNERLIALAADGGGAVIALADGSILAQLGAEPGRLACARASADGAWLLSASGATANDGEPPVRIAVLRSALDGRRVAELRGHAGEIVSCDFAADGSLAMTASRDGTARLWRVPSGEPLGPPLDAGAPIACADLSPDGRRLVAGVERDGAERAWLFDLERGTRVALAGTGAARAGTVSAEFSPDGARVATSSLDRVIHIWSARDARAIEAFRTALAQPLRSQWTPDGTRLVTLNSRDLVAHVWFAESRPDLYVLAGHDGAVKSASFDREGSRALTVGADGTARLWHTPRDATEGDGREPGALLATLGGASDPILSARFDATGTIVLALTSRGPVRRFDAASGAETGAPLDHPVAATSAELDARGERALTVAADGVARIFDLADGAARAITSDARCARFTPSGEHAIVGLDSDRVLVVEVATARVVNEHAWDASGAKRGVVALDVRPDGTEIAAACRDGKLRFFAPLASGPSRPSHTVFEMRDVAYDASGAYVLATGPNGRGAVRVRELDAKRTVTVGYDIVHSDDLTGGSFSPDGTLVLTSSKDGTVYVRTTVDGVPVAHLVGHRGPVLSASFSRDGGPLRVVTASADGTARVWPVDPLPPALARKPRELADWEVDREKRLARPLRYE